MTINVPTQIRQALDNGADLAISISGGKDSQAMLSTVMRFWNANSFTGRVLAIHADLGRAEWTQTMDTVKAQAAYYGVELVVVQRTKGDLVQRIQDRAQQLKDQDVKNRDGEVAYPAGTPAPFWPGNNRYCTSDLKRDPINTFLRKLGSVVISAEGIRGQESGNRAAKPCWETRSRITTKVREDGSQLRQGLTWRPIHHWSEQDVWAEIGGRNGHLVHPAYALGNERLSCALCIYASRGDLLNGARNRPDTFAAYRQLEDDYGYTFTAKLALADLEDELADDDQDMIELPVIQPTEQDSAEAAQDETEATEMSADAPNNILRTHVFAGVNTAKLAAATESYPILVAFDQVGSEPAVWTDEILPRLEAGAYSMAILDSGAFAAWKRGRSIDIDAYVDFATRYGHLFDLVVNLDSIDGNIEYANANLAKLKAAGVDAMPVYHDGEPMAQLDFCIQHAAHVRCDVTGQLVPWVGLGVPGTSPKRHHAFLSQVLPITQAAGVAVHGFKMTRYLADYALDSADSSTWIAEMRAAAYGSRSDFLANHERLMFGQLDRTEQLRLVADSHYSAPAVRGTFRHGIDAARGQGRTFWRNVAGTLERIMAGKLRGHTYGALAIDLERWYS